MNKILVILGPTSSGKTDFALEIAKKFEGELVSCDSRQVYKGLDIGTGKMPSDKFKIERGDGWWQVNRGKIWMYDVIDPKKQYTVYHYVKDVNKVLNDIIKRKKLPIIVGGTGLYLKALLEGLPNLNIPANKQLREKLQKLSLHQLQKRLQKQSPGRWAKMNNSDRLNPRRLIRAIELEMQIWIHKTADINARARGLMSEEDVLKIGLFAERETLYQRIDERVESRIAQGLIEEAKSLHKRGLSLKRMKQLGLEYGALADYLTGKIKDRDQLTRLIQGKIHNFARRQLTWFKKEKNVIWFDITKKDSLARIENLVRSWYDSSGVCYA